MKLALHPTVTSRKFILENIFAAWAFAFTLAGVSSLFADEKPAAPTTSIVISVREQKLAVMKDDEVVAKYPISTSRYGVGDKLGSYRTPTGQLRVYAKIGGGSPEGMVFKHREPTGEILSPNAPGRDPVTTRILWLDGLEAGNKNALARGIYIHGTAEEKYLGRPASYGCIRMRAQDVVKVFDAVSLGAPVAILPGKLPSPHRLATPSLLLALAKEI